MPAIIRYVLSPMSESQKIEASTQKTYKISRADLPLCCPMPNMRLWDSHPRIYMPIEDTGREVCPYCGAEYILKDFQKEQHAK